MTKRQPFYELLAEHIKESETFDLHRDEGQYPNIHWVIARSMLEDYSEFERHKLLTDYYVQVKNSFNHAIGHLMENGINVYRSIGAGKRNIQFISIDPNYDDCQSLDFERIKNNVFKSVSTFKRSVQKMHPDKIPEIQSETSRFENKLLSI